MAATKRKAEADAEADLGCKRTPETSPVLDSAARPKTRFDPENEAPAPTVLGRFSRAVDRRFNGLDERAWSGAWMFVQMADTQFGMLRASTDKRDIEEEVSMAKLAVEHINRLQPKFVIICGDLVNEYPVTASRSTSDPELMAYQVEAFKDVMNRIDGCIPLVCVCGNHDVGDLPDRPAIELYRSRFGDDYFEFWAGGSLCIVLNSSLLSVQESSRLGDKADVLQLAAAQDQWLDAVLPGNAGAAAARPPLLVFSHIPPFIYEPDEPKGYFNLEPAVRSRVLRRLKQAGARKWFCGHFHRNAGGWDEDLEVVVTAAVGTNLPMVEGIDAPGRLELRGFNFDARECSPRTSGLRCICVSGSREVKHKFFTLDSVPVSVDPSAELPGWSGTRERAASV